MPGFSFIHAADLHLDSPFAAIGSDSPEQAAVMAESTRAALWAVRDACISNDVDFLVLAGDVFDLREQSLRAQLELYSCLKLLASRGIHTYLVAGNHDPYDSVRARLDWPEQVHFFRPELGTFPVVVDGRVVAQVQGISYRQSVVTDNLASHFRKRPGDPFTVGVLHANVGGIAGHGNYAPCTVDDLIASGIDYWALGHVHAPSVLRSAMPTIAYPGCTQGRNPRETGAHGCYLVRVDEDGRAGLEFIPTDSVRWEVCDVAIDGLSTLDELVSAVQSRLTALAASSEGRGCVARIRLVGRGPLHRELSLSAESLTAALCWAAPGRWGSQCGYDPCAAAGAERADSDGLPAVSPAPGSVRIESIQDCTLPEVDRNALLLEGTLVSDYLSLIDEAAADAGGLDAIRRSLLGMVKRNRLAAEIVDELSDDELIAILERAEVMGLDLLLKEAD